MKAVLHRLQKMAIDNSPTILSAIAATGSVVTAYLAGKASFQAARKISEHDAEEALMRREPNSREKLELVWKLYIPAASTGVATVACIICANRVGTRRAAAMAAAFSLSERAFEEYREKVVEKLGDRREREFRDELVQDRIRADPPSREVVLVSGEVLCQDGYSGRYFTGTVDGLNNSKNEVNHRINTEGYASLTDFYDLIGLERTYVSDDVGWGLNKLLELEFTTSLTPDQKPCLTVNYRVQPTRDYYKFK